MDSQIVLKPDLNQNWLCQNRYFISTVVLLQDEDVTVTSYVCPRQSRADGTSHFVPEVHAVCYFFNFEDLFCLTGIY